MVAALAASAALGADLSYTGRLVDAQGLSVVGTITIDVKFYTASTGGSPIDISTTGDKVTVSGVVLDDGMFNIAVPLSAADEHTIFSSFGATAYIEITDVTHSV